MKKIITLSILIALLASCTNVDSNKFDLQVTVKSDNYNEMLFLHYDNKKDSAVQKNGMYTFNGIVDKVTAAYLTLNNRISTGERDFYLENEKMNLDVSISNRMVNEFEVFDIKINTFTGTKTEQIRTDFISFKEGLAFKNDKEKLLYNEVERLIKAYPNNDYIVSLFDDITKENELPLSKIQTLYAVLNEHQTEIDPFLTKKIEYKIFPSRRIVVNDSISHFELPDDKGSLFSTKDLDNKYTLLEFWASWCVPCRKAFPDLKKTHKEYESQGFSIVGISIDRDETKWKNAIEKDQLTWINLLDSGDFTGIVANMYGVFGVPANYLINKEGIVVAKDISAQELDIFLKKELK